MPSRLSSNAGNRVSKPSRSHHANNKLSAPKSDRGRVSTTFSESSATLSPEEILIETFTGFVDDFFFLLFVQHDDDIFNVAYPKLVSQQVQDDVDDVLLNFEGLKQRIQELRATISARRIISQSVLVAPPDADGQTRTAGHNGQFSGIQNGTEVVVSVVAVGTVMIEANDTAKLRVERLVLVVENA